MYGNPLNTITITPVNNGYLVEMPQSNTFPLSGMREAVTGIKDMLSELKEDKNDLSAILRERGVDQPKPAPALQRDTHAHIFVSFADVLEFLKNQITE